MLSDKVARLEQEISDLNERLKTSEQAKEHWKLECQLIQMKHDKLKKAGDEIAEEEETSDGDKQMALMFKARIDGLVAEKLAADSKATHFYLECAGLLRQTRARERDKARALARLSEAQAKVRLYFCPYFIIYSQPFGHLGLRPEPSSSYPAMITGP